MTEDNTQYTLADIKAQDRILHSPYVKLVLNPLSQHLALVTINRTKLSPIQVTCASAMVAVLAAVSFVFGQYVLGAILFQCGVILDGVDGYVARVRKTGSDWGMLLDSYVDVFRVLLALSALAFAEHLDPATSVLLILFLGLHFGETLIDSELINVKRWYEKEPPGEPSAWETAVLSYVRFCERFGLKGMLVHYQERLFIVLFLGPVFFLVKEALIFAVILSFLFLHLKIALDVSLIREHARGGDQQLYIRETGGFKTDISNP